MNSRSFRTFLVFRRKEAVFHSGRLVRNYAVNTIGVIPLAEKVVSGPDGLKSGYHSSVLPRCGSVLGIDVGYSPTKRTTAFCCFSWDEDSLAWSHSRATAEAHSREQALEVVYAGTPFLAVAIDGPLAPGLTHCSAYRTCERLLSRGRFQKRGKPGPTHAGSGPNLHKHATLLAEMAVACCAITPSVPRFAVSPAGIYEAFPNLFLGVLCLERNYPVRPTKARCWTDTLFPLVRRELDELIQASLPGRRYQNLTQISGHETVAAFVCALTALLALEPRCVAVGSSADGYIVLPPLSAWGLSDSGVAWAERELNDIVSRLSAAERLVPADIVWDIASP